MYIARLKLIRIPPLASPGLTTKCGAWPVSGWPVGSSPVRHKFFGPRPVLVRPDQKVLPVLVLGQKSAVRFRPTHPVLVQPGLAVAVTGYPRVIRMRAR